MKEKDLKRWMLVRVIIIFAIYIALQAGTILVTGYDLTENPFQMTQYSNDTFTTSDVILKVEDESILKIKDLTEKDGSLFVTLTPVSAGRTTVEITRSFDGEYMEMMFLEVEPGGLIINRNTDNFSGYKLARLYMTGLVIACTLLLFAGFHRSQKYLRYSYQSIFYVGFGIWNAMLAALMLWGVTRNFDMANMYSILKNGPYLFTLFSFPVVFIFCVLLSISNVSLMRHEGMRVRNAHGIQVSLLMIAGFIFIFWLSEQITMGSEFEINAYTAFVNVVSSFYTLMECFLMGSVICGILAAKHQPAFDKDYIVILGCKVRKDGTLYPLIRGRVDRAIAFYKAQLAATGKKAVFLPSGGQGGDETISEAEAMKRYLLTQGFDEDQVIIEDQSKNTKQNMAFSKKIIESRTEGAKAAFSTTNFHVFRSGIISRQADFAVDGMGGPTKWYFWPNAFIREVFGMIVYEWKVLIVVFIPIVVFIVAIQFTL